MGDVYMAKLAEQARPCALAPSCAAPQHGHALARWHGPALVGHARHPTTHCWQAERYEEMVEYMKKVAVASETDLSLEESPAPSPLLRT